MEDSQKNLVDGLEHLLSICRDGERGYQTAADNAKDDDLKSVFSKYASERGDYATQLQSLILQAGGDPNQSSGTSGAFHRAWIDIKEAFTGHDRDALLSSCETGEKAAIDAYRNFFSDVFEYRGDNVPSSPYTTTSGTDAKYTSTGMDTGNGLDNASIGYSNENLGTNETLRERSFSGTDEDIEGTNPGMENTDSRSTLDWDDNDASDFSKYGSVYKDEALRNTNAEVYPTIKTQLEGIEAAYRSLRLFKDKVSR